MIATIQLDGNSLTIADVAAVAEGKAKVALAPAAKARMQTTRNIVEELASRGEPVYGVTTGFGKLSDIAIAPDQLAQLQVNLIRSHAAGVGPRLPEREVRAMMLLRANCLAKGFSGGRPALVELVCEMLNAGLWPDVPEQGSVGASGDLAPLAHLALSLVGEGELNHAKGKGAARDVLAAHKLAPVLLGPKEGLALINGTQAHTSIAALSLVEARRCWNAAHAPPSTRVFTPRVGSADRWKAPSAFSPCWKAPRFASRIAKVIRACRTRMACAVCRRYTALCCRRLSLRNRWSHRS
jgi:histidine ammonia-lyase